MVKDKIYKTRQKEEVLRFFEEHPDECFSAKDIIDSPFVRVGEATVFRCLTRLTEEGLLRKYTGVGGALYQLSSSESCKGHFHLKCTGCGRVEHLDCSVIDDMSRHIAEEHSFSVDISRTVIYGLCAVCRLKA